MRWWSKVVWATDASINGSLPESSWDCLEADILRTDRTERSLHSSFISMKNPLLPSLSNQVGALLGIGTGIRHRAGVQVGIGWEYVAYRQPSYEITVGPEAAIST